MTLDLDDTIAAIATAPGGGLRGIVRISGVNAAAVLSRMGSFAQPLAAVRRASIVAGTVNLPQDIGRLPVTLYWWPTAKSYPREPCGELHMLGSPPLMAAMLEAACAAGARLARPGEFTLRAFLAGRLDLTQAEAVLGVIEADSRRALDAALGQLAGGLARPLADLRERLLDLLAHLEAGLDFVEEDIEFISRPALLDQLRAAQRQIAELAAQMESRGEAAELPRVVIYGLPNTGKSSLLNALAGSDAAITSPVAGTTRDFVTREASFGGQSCVLIDTAGVAEAAALSGLGRAMQAATECQSEAADLKLMCIDMTRGLAEWEAGELARMDSRRLVVGTKCDLASSLLASAPLGVRTSSRSGEGLGVLKSRIARLLPSPLSEGGAIAATADRCRESLRLAGEGFLRAGLLAEGSGGEELIAAEVRLALEEVGHVSGAIYTDDILDRVFSRFCIGK